MLQNCYVPGKFGNCCTNLKLILFKTDKKVCPTDVKARVNCGYPGIPADQCHERGCCFESHPPAVPWCFYHTLVAEGKV